MAIREIGMLPKLEGTEHVNMALIIKFIRNYFFEPMDYPALGRQDQVADDAYLFNQFTGGLGKVRFPDYRLAYEGWDLPNVKTFRSQVEALRNMLVSAPPSAEQTGSIDYMLAAGELFTLTVYAQLLLENSKIYGVEDRLVDQMFDFLVRDFSGYALNMIVEFENSPEQEADYQSMIQKPARDKARTEYVWSEHVLAMAGAYKMND
jgi:acyl-CoA dehydrogenase